MTSSTPLRKSMREPFDQVAVERMWRGVAARRTPRAPARRLVWLAAAALVLVGVFFAWRPASSGAGPLRLEGGASLGMLTAPEAPRAFALDDGSRVELGVGATFLARENSGRVLDGALLEGAATFDVRPGGPRKWTIDCGLAKVEVLGTRFVIEARKERVSVRVERGHVRVTSAGGAKDLLAGEFLEVTDPTPVLDPSPSPSPTPSPSSTPIPIPIPTPTPNPSPTLTAIPSPVATPIPTASWQSLAGRGDYEGAYSAIGAQGIARATSRASVDELLALADVARLSGHPADAVAPLQRIVVEGGPRDTRAPLAAFTLGRIELDTLGHPARAADAFARAIDLGLPGGLAEDGYARLVEARVKAGDREGARAAFDAYGRAFPQGARSTTMRRWLQGDMRDQRSSQPSSP
jgi:transmembrane sensor